MKFLIKNLLIVFAFFASANICLAQSGAALDFDGVNDYVLVPNNSLLNASKVTIETWVKWNSTGTGYQFLCGKNYEQFEIYTSNAGGIGIRFMPAPNVYLDAPSTVLSTNVWTHIAYVYDPSIALAKLYVNGNEQVLINNGTNPLTTPIGISTSPFNIGRRLDNTYLFKGKLDEFRIWNRVLTQCEIQNSMNCELLLPQSGLIAYYKFNQGIAAGTNSGVSTLADSSGNNISGTLTNFGLIGAASNWVTPGGVVNGTVCNAPTATISITHGSNPSCAGLSVPFSSSVSNAGADPIYQWTRNSTNLSGATGLTYTTDSLKDKDTIRFVVSNSCGFLQASDSIVVHINRVTPKALIGSDAYTALCPGDTVKFEAFVFHGGESPIYQWTKNSIDISGADDSVYTTSSLSNNDTIRCKIISNSNEACLTTTASTSRPEIIKVSPVYTFIGNGNWEDPSNWNNHETPPPVLPVCSEIVITPAMNGECVLNSSLIILNGAKLTVEQGKKFKVQGDLINGYDSAHSYVYDSTLGLGGETPTVAETQNIPYFEEVDISFLPVFNRGVSIASNSFIDVPEPGYQGQKNSCTGWAVGYGIMGAYYKKLEGNSSYNGIDKIVSPVYIWNQLNTINNIHYNIGLSIPRALNLVKDQGCCKWADMSDDFVYFSDPPLIARVNADKYRNLDFMYWQMSVVDIDLIKQAIEKKYLIAFGSYVCEGFRSGRDPQAFIKKNGQFIWINNAGPLIKNANGNLATHAMVICGYDDVMHAFKVLNSWNLPGFPWCNDGFTWIDYNFFKKMVVKRRSQSPMYPDLYIVSTRKRADLNITNDSCLTT